MSLKNLDLPTTLPAGATSEIATVVRRLVAEATHVVHCTSASVVPDEQGLLARLSREFLCGYPTRKVLLESKPGIIADETFETTAIKNIAGAPNNQHRGMLQQFAGYLLFHDAADEVVSLLERHHAAELQVRWSWGDPHHFVQRLRAQTETLWHEQCAAIAQVPPVQHRNGSLVVSEASASGYQINSQAAHRPPPVDLRDYQKDAVRAWRDAGGRGIFAMATGAGKTITALTLACRVAERNRPFVIIVVCPFLDLAKQWLREMDKFGFFPVACFHGRDSWQIPLRNAYQRVSAGLTDCVSVVASNATFLSPVFQRALSPSLATHMLIADEVHNLGAAQLKDALPKKIALRLGLSATPVRHGDAAGTQALIDYFGNVVYEFSIERAIKKDVLVPYRYYPVLVDLTVDETDAYRELTAKIGRFFVHTDEEKQSDKLKILLIKRARLLASAANKLPALSETLLRHGVPITKAIVYCGDGTVEHPATGELDRQIVAVTRLLGETHGLKVRKFTCDESSEERAGILDALRGGRLQALVAIRCLDEGIDVPDVQLGFLMASSTNPRQFIQRRGRLLRRAPGKSHAVIYDFIVQPPSFSDESDSTAFNVERRLFRRELKRVLEFCRSAENGPVALQKLQGLRIEYNLLAH